MENNYPYGYLIFIGYFNFIIQTGSSDLFNGLKNILFGCQEVDNKKL